DADSGIVLEQVAAGACLDRRHDLELVAEHGDDHDHDGRPAPGRFANDVETVAVGQAEIDEQYGGARQFERRANLAASADRSRDLQTCLGLSDATHEGGAREVIVLDDENGMELGGHSASIGASRSGGYPEIGVV